MKKLIVLPLMFLIISCESSNNYSGTCLIQTTNRAEVFNNVYEIYNEDDRTHIKVVDGRGRGDFALAVEYIAYNVQSISCS